MHSCLPAPRAQSSFWRTHGVALPIYNASMSMKAEQERVSSRDHDKCTAVKNEGCVL